MKVVYSPKDGQRREWPFEPDDIEVIDASFIKKQTRMAHGEWKQALLEQDADALHGLMWLLLKSDGNPLLRWTDVRFRMSEVTFEFDDIEVSALIDALASMPPFEDAEKEQARDALVAQLEEQGVDVSARVAGRLADPEFKPTSEDEAAEGDPKA